MKSLISVILTLACILTLTACGCSSSIMDETQAQGTTKIPDVIPTLDTNIPDPEIDTQMPIYTDGTDSTAGTDITIPTSNTENK